MNESNELRETQTTTANAPRRPALDFTGHVLRILAVFSALAVLALFTGCLLTLQIGHWLVKQDHLEKADAIAVLSGGFPARAFEAVELYHQGYAKQIWLTNPGRDWPMLEEMGIHYPTEANFNYRLLVHAGVPAKAIHILEDPIGNTADEVAVIGDALEEKGDKSIIIVTEKAHTRRVHLLWARLDNPHGRAIIRGVTDDGFDPNDWWNHTEDTQQVIHEMMSLANLWAGMPVHTRIHDQAPVAVSSSRQSSATVPTSQAAAKKADPLQRE